MDCRVAALLAMTKNARPRDDVGTVIASAARQSKSMQSPDAVPSNPIGGEIMGYADLIAKEAMALPEQRQAEILDFIAFLKTREVAPARMPANGEKSVREIEAFFHSFKINTNSYKFDRDDANAR